jgi:hypothetical protein
MNVHDLKTIDPELKDQMQLDYLKDKEGKNKWLLEKTDQYYSTD